ncbi:MAG: hypothetical protein JO022_19045 [Acidobacteriaceae bacterium]|nr:hypothetical protein [Acidobacteriaceae bacterium]
MNRRTCLTAVVAGAAALSPAAESKPIQLHVDLTVDPAQEREMLSRFHTEFKQAAMKQPGYLDAKMLKLRSTLGGQAPEGVNYRFVLRFQSEELRQKWVASAVHQRVWPLIENTLKHKNYNVLLFDEEA